MADTLLNRVDAICRFAIWAGNQLIKFEFCEEVFPECSKKEKDLDFKDVSNYNYIYHRYRCFHPAFLAFINSTPTHRNLINTRLKNRYDGTVVFDCIEVATYLDLNGGSIPNNRQLIEYLLESDVVRLRKIAEATSRISDWRKQETGNYCIPTRHGIISKGSGGSGGPLDGEAVCHDTPIEKRYITSLKQNRTFRIC